jgi:stringent starvation protein B
LKEENYKPINVDDGISPEELAAMAIFTKWQGDGYKTEVKSTDNALQQQQISETARHNKATEGIDQGNLDLETDKWNATMKGGETVKNGAMEFAKRLYSDMAALADKNGVISPDQLRKLNVEQLKYLGVEVPEERSSDGKIIKAGGFKPLATQSEMAIQLLDGKINVYVPAEGSKKIEVTSDGKYVGVLDNTRSTTVFNVATNRLNEQLKNAGAKELNAYMPIDLGTGGVSTNQVGGSVSTGASTLEKSAIKTTRKGLPVFKN